jgi:hypothetical protein
MMASLAVSGINLGYTKVSTLADPITVPDGAIDGIVYNLAIKLAPQFGASVPAELAMNAREAKKAMLKLAVVPMASQFPSTLPIGSGNQSFGNDRFYGDLSGGALTEQDQFIGVE